MLQLGHVLRHDKQAYLWGKTWKSEYCAFQLCVKNDKKSVYLAFSHVLRLIKRSIQLPYSHLLKHNQEVHTYLSVMFKD